MGEEAVLAGDFQFVPRESQVGQLQRQQGGGQSTVDERVQVLYQSVFDARVRPGEGRK